MIYLVYISIVLKYIDMELNIGNEQFDIKDIRFNFGRHVERYSATTNTWERYGYYDEFTGEEIEQILKCIPVEVLEAELERRNTSSDEDSDIDEDDDYYILP